MTEKKDELAAAPINEALDAGKNPAAAIVQQPSAVLREQLARGVAVAKSGRATSV